MKLVIGKDVKVGVNVIIDNIEVLGVDRIVGDWVCRGVGGKVKM